ncbi:hypothetical protein G7046_g2190 [Stylonectria norvegica]|nr:hypothetical protein G7046_g2190 [Stylonectria norvegica]
MALGTATGPAKLKAVTGLVAKLTDDLVSASLTPQDRNQALEELKIYGRDPKDADPIFTDDGFAPKASSRLKSESSDDEFLLSRVLFLSTYAPNVDLEDLIEKHNLAKNIADNLARHAKQLSSTSKSRAEPMQDMALVETLKLMFNVTHHCPSRVSDFDAAVAPLVSLLWKQDISASRPLDPPFGQLINALLNLELDSECSRAALYPENDANKVSSRLIELLDPAMKVYADEDLNAVVTPLVSVLRKVYEYAPESTKEHIRSLLLPTAEDREEVLGKGERLPARLLQNSTNPIATALREAISHLLFDMSDRDAAKFVENVGYGFASGFLYQNKVPMPNAAKGVFDSNNGQKAINPITGQYFDAEKPVEEPEMTQEEKEREAERLFRANMSFLRLKKTGIVDVQNPMEAMVRDGRYRELGDDEVEELE